MLAELYKLINKVSDAPTPASNNKLSFGSTQAGIKNIKRVIPKVLTYDRQRNRSEWFKLEYDFKALQIAQHVDSVLLRSIKKKVDRILVAGIEFVGKNEEAVDYIRRRILEIEMVNDIPFMIQISELAEELIKNKNCIWVKTRSSDSSSGQRRVDFDGTELEPVACYTAIALPTVEVKTNLWGKIKKFRQVLPDGDTKEYPVSDVIFFFADRKPGFIAGMPDLLPALDDIALLRRIEEHIEDLIETSLFPVYHYKVGTDAMPERVGTDGKFESEILERKIKFMEPGGVIITDHRLEISALGSEGKALNIDTYVEYFFNRAIVSSGSTKVDLGIEGATRATANTLSKSTVLDVEAVQVIIKSFIDFYVISELLLEGGFNPFDEKQKVEIRLGVIDKEERLAFENQQIQMVANNLITVTEARKNLGYAPFTDKDLEDTYYKLFEEPGMLAKAIVPGSAAGEALATAPQSNITPKGIASEKKLATKLAVASRPTGRPTNPKSSGSKSAVSSKAKPSNQTGTRSGPKLNKDFSLIVDDQIVNISIPAHIEQTEIDSWLSLVNDRYVALKSFNISPQTIADNLLYRLEYAN